MFKSDKIIQDAIIPQIINTLGHVYPELERSYTNICETFAYEAEVYKSLRDRTKKEFESLNIKSSVHICLDDVIDFPKFPHGFRDVEKRINGNCTIESLPAEYVFEKLHINCGLSEELIEKIALEKNLSIDMDEFALIKLKKRNETKSKYKISECDYLNSLEENNVAKTDYRHMYEYDYNEKADSYSVQPITAIVQSVSPAETDGNYNIVLDKTNFYHIAGGQDCDVGKIIDTDNNISFNVSSVEIHNGYVVHTGRFENKENSFQINQNVNLYVDSTKRTALTRHHTGMHLLQAAMKQITGQIIFQQSSHVSHLNLKCDLGTVGKGFNIEQLNRVECLIREIIAANVPIKTHLLAVHELYALDNLTTVPGATYPDNGIRVLKVIDQTNNFLSIEPCCGTHAKNTGDLHGFCITSFKMTNNGTYDIIAIAGPLVETAKRNETQFLENFDVFKRRTKNKNIDENEWKAIQAEINKFKTELVKNQLLPYLTRSKVWTELEEIEKVVRIELRAIVRKGIVEEMQDVLAMRVKNNEAFIVHVLNTPNALDKQLMLEAEQICHDLPVILLNVSNNQIIDGRACIPLKYTNNKFNAKHWFQQLLSSFKVNCGPAKKKGHFSISILPEACQSAIETNDLKTAVQRSKDLAREKFAEIVSADEDKRKSYEDSLIEKISSIRLEMDKEISLENALELEARLRHMRSNTKESLLQYTIREKCMTELTQIDEDFAAVRHKLEK